MKDIATARRQKGDYGKHNLLQVPLFLEQNHLDEDRTCGPPTPSDGALRIRNRDGSESDEASAVGSKRWSRRSPVSERHLAIPGTLRLDFAILADLSLLLDLVPLTGLRLGIATLSHLEPESTHTKSFSASHIGSRKLLSFIPSRYGKVPSLTHATDCVVAKLRQMLLSPESRSTKGDTLVLTHYTKALRALQAALDDESQQVTPETLCATVLLGVFEVSRSALCHDFTFEAY